MNAVLFALLLSQPSSQPAAAAGGQGGAGDVYGELTIIYELAEKVLRTQESWTLRNMSGKEVPAQAVTIDLAGVRKLRLDDSSIGFRASDDGTRIVADRAIAQEDRTVSGTYEVPLSGSSLVVRRRLPFNMGRARVILEDSPGLSLSSNVTFTKRSRELNGLNFAIWDFPAMPPGQELELRFSGLPARATWPRSLAVAIAFLIAGGGAWLLRTRRVPGADHTMALGPLSGKARRDRLVKAIELLKRDLDAGKIDEKRYQRRHEALMQELAVVLREIEIENRQQMVHH
jgi:hypothetical protein